MRKRILSAGALLAGMITAAFLAGKGREEEPLRADELEPAELTICLIGAEPADMDMVLEKLNEHCLADLNCTVSITWIGWGDYPTQYPLLLSAGEAADLVYAATWLDFTTEVNRGAFAPLEDLLEEYAPQSMEELSDMARTEATFQGHLYALPANYTNYNVLGPIVRGDLLEKYNLDEITSFDDYMNYCGVIAREELLDPMGMCATDITFDDMYLMSLGYYPVTGTTGSPYWVDLNSRDYEVYFRSECPEMEDFLRQSEGWYQKGYWDRNVLASKDETKLASGTAASRIHNYDAYVGEYGKHPEWKLQYSNLTSPLIRQSYMQDAMAIPIDSKNKERAMMLLEKLRTDEDYYMLINYGIEGYHYEWNRQERTITFLNTDYGNEPGTWGFREEHFKLWDDNLSQEALQLREEYETEAIDTMLADFQVELQDISTQYNAVSQVMSIYYNPLKLGYIEYESGKEQLDEQLALAGNEEVKQEIKSQISAYLSNYNTIHEKSYGD